MGGAEHVDDARARRQRGDGRRRFDRVEVSHQHAGSVATALADQRRHGFRLTVVTADVGGEHPEGPGRGGQVGHEEHSWVQPPAALGQLERLRAHDGEPAEHRRPLGEVHDRCPRAIEPGDPEHPHGGRGVDVVQAEPLGEPGCHLTAMPAPRGLLERDDVRGQRPEGLRHQVEARLEVAVAPGPARQGPAVEHVQGDEADGRGGRGAIGGCRGGNGGADEGAGHEALHEAGQRRHLLIPTPRVRLATGPCKDARGARITTGRRHRRWMRHNEDLMTSPADLGLVDALGRPLRNLRVSVTDRCNLRCQYCMPEEEYTWLRRSDLLTFEEIQRLVDVFTTLGVNKVRLTGGEPLLRRDLPNLVRMLAGMPAVEDLAMTTNGVLLADQADALRSAGLHRVTVSLDTLRPERFRALTRRDDHAAVLRGIDAVRGAGLPDLKLDTVVIRGVNDDELVDLIEFARGIPAEVRFIEYMDVGGATHWSREQVVSRAEMLERLGARYGRIEAVREESSAPAERFRLPDGTTLGIIASTTMPFCRLCDRSRLTADGTWYLCLYAQRGVDLRTPLRDGASREELEGLIVQGWARRRDRGAEERKELEAVGHRGVLIQIEGLRQDP